MKLKQLLMEIVVNDASKPTIYLKGEEKWEQIYDEITNEAIMSYEVQVHIPILRPNSIMPTGRIKSMANYQQFEYPKLELYYGGEYDYHSPNREDHFKKIKARLAENFVLDVEWPGIMIPIEKNLDAIIYNGEFLDKEDIPHVIDPWDPANWPAELPPGEDGEALNQLPPA